MFRCSREHAEAPKGRQAVQSRARELYKRTQPRRKWQSSTRQSAHTIQSKSTEGAERPTRAQLLSRRTSVVRTSPHVALLRPPVTAAAAPTRRRRGTLNAIFASDVRHVELSQQVIQRLDRLVLCRMLCVDTSGHRFDDGVVMRACEKRDAQPRCAGRSGGGWRLHHSVDGRAPTAIRPYFIQVADVDDEGVGARQHRVPLPGGKAHLPRARDRRGRAGGERAW